MFFTDMLMLPLMWFWCDYVKSARGAAKEKNVGHMKYWEILDNLAKIGDRQFEENNEIQYVQCWVEF